MNIKGVMVVFITRRQTGTDPLGAPLFEEVERRVPDVLISPTKSDDVVNTLTLTGRKAVYTLAIPKDEDAEAFVMNASEARFFGERWKIIGTPTKGIEYLIPLRWNMKVEVERYD